MQSKEFYIGVRGVHVEVTEQVYLVYHRSKRRDRYYECDIKIERAVRDEFGDIIGYIHSKEYSLEKLISLGTDFVSEQDSPEDIAINALMLSALGSALDKLTYDDFTFINALFLSNDGKGMSEREYAKIYNVPRRTVAYQKNKILGKLRKIIEKN